MTNETNKPFTVNDRAVSARMTKRQKLILGMGLAFQMNLFEPATVTAVEPARTEKFIPIRVAALGHCPMCGKVIVLGQTECFKCGWKVEPGKLVPFDREIGPDK